MVIMILPQNKLQLIVEEHAEDNLKMLGQNAILLADPVLAVPVGRHLVYLRHQPYYHLLLILFTHVNT